jgi:hypothetical protein
MFRLRRRRHALVALTLLIALTSCVRPSNTPTAYDDVTRENFLEGCTGVYEVGGTTSTLGVATDQRTCECAYDWISQNVPFDQFEELNTNASKDAAAADVLPPEIADGLRQACPGWGVTSPSTAGVGPTTSVPR